MDANKDYYATLGLTPSADAVVIRAAYKALAQRYHPDKSGVGQAHGSVRMAEINEAYSVLSEPAKRAEYDRLRKNTTQNADTAFADGDAEPTSNSPLDEDWQTATLFYPEIEDIRAGLARISWKLAEAFRARLLSSKEFQTARTISDGLEREFLRIYFGSNSRILQFAKELITSNLKAPARELNRAVKVLGDTANPESIIRTIRDKHGIVALGESNHPHKNSSSGGHPQQEHSIYGITARDYARANNQQLGDVIKDIQSGRIRGRWVKGDYYVDIGFNKNPDQSGDGRGPCSKPGKTVCTRRSEDSRRIIEAKQSI
jgi:curved DNA-binding protein CbpA